MISPLGAIWWLIRFTVFFFAIIAGLAALGAFIIGFLR